MTQYPCRIPIDTLIEAGSLFADFVTRPGGAAQSILGGFDAAALARRLEHKPRVDSEAREARARVARRLAEYNRSIGVDDALVDRLDGFAARDTRVVITGQQPGVLGGPLMTLHKIAAARALAARVESEHGVPCVPVYWMGADDADFAEIREVVLLGRDHRALSTSLPTGAHEAAMPVGAIATRWVAGLWDGLDAFVAGGGSAAVSDIVARAVAAGEDHAGVTARIVVGLTGGQVLVVDGREGFLRECARDVILDYVAREADIRERVETGGRDLEAKGFHAQLALGPDSGVFVLENGRRSKVALDRRAELRARLEERITDASPGVVLRNLVQDVVFDPVATVLGPAEIAYRAQIRGVYDLLGVEPPVAYPRLFGTWVPSAVAELVETTGGDPSRLVTAPADLVAEVFRSQGDGELSAARARLDEGVRACVDAFLGAAEGRMDAGALEKTRKRLADVSRRVEQASAAVDDVGRKRALERWPFLDGLTDVFARRGDAQERYLSMLSPCLSGGLEASAVIQSAAAMHVEATMDGRVEHIVYSS